MLAAPLQAAPDLEGRFHGRGEGKLDLKVYDLGSDGPDGGYLVIADTAVANECTGSVRGVAQTLNVTTLQLRRQDSGMDEACELTLRFSLDSNRVQMTAKGCSYFHGASCDFVGSLRRR